MAERKTAEEKAAEAAAKAAEEKAAEEAAAVEKAAQASTDNAGAEEGEESGPKYKIASEKGVYVDIYTGWTVRDDEAKPLPANVSPQTLERIKSGYLTEA